MFRSFRDLLARARQRLRPHTPTPPSRTPEWQTEKLAPADSSGTSALQVIGQRSHNSCAFRLYIPALTKADQPLPLLVMLHGCRQDAQSFAAGTLMNQLADHHAFAVLYPEQSHAANPLGCWNWFSAATMSGGGDAAMIVRITDAVIEHYRFDSQRIYVAGMSAGGALARVLAVCYPHLFAACASHSGVMFRAASSGLQALNVLKKGSRYSPVDTAQRAARLHGRSPRFVPTLIIHGMDDDAVNPVNAAQTMLQAESLAKADNLTPLIKRQSQHSENGRTCAVHDQLIGDQVMIREVIINGLGHAWSGGNASLPYNDAHGPSASQLIWDFVSQHHR